MGLAFEPGDWMEVISDGLRVRSRPGAGDDSAKYEPLLHRGANFLIVDGPVAASGYLWYLVDLGTASPLEDGVHEGWVAAGDHDGTPWIENVPIDTEGPDAVGGTGWPTATWSGVTMAGVVERGDEWFRGLSITLTGLTPGDVVALKSTGDYRVKWICGTQPEPCGEIGCGHAYGELATGTITVDGTAIADGGGVATTRLDFGAPAPTASCPTDPGARWGMQWDEWVLTVADAAHRLTLRSEPIGGGWTY